MPLTDVERDGIALEIPDSSRAVFDAMNRMGAACTPFVFLIDFELGKPLAIPAAVVDPGWLQYDFRGRGNARTSPYPKRALRLRKWPVEPAVFRRVFDQVVAREQAGDSYLVNLTFRTEISINLGLEEVFHRSKAPYRMWMRDCFSVFSPEPFVRICRGRISTFPMKGTIDASEPDAENRILLDPKEMAEHVTVVDLLRNDLSRVARDVQVRRFRYIEKIETPQKTLFQVSSHIEGRLPEHYTHQLGDILVSLLPAGSVSGAPKPSTLAIIREAEEGPRGYYCGVMGFFDGRDLDTAVMIRYIEQDGGRFWYRSGGGITVNSRADQEYREMIDKIYVPVD
jgi:para-aminobenzoate synthetase component I